jgi:hypothetical protein
MTAILQMRPLMPAPHPEVFRLERLLRRKTFEIEILQEALDAARVKFAMGPRLGPDWMRGRNTP